MYAIKNRLSYPFPNRVSPYAAVLEEAVEKWIYNDYRFGATRRDRNC